MTAIEIVVIILASLVVISVFGIRIYRKVHHLPVDECVDCQNDMKKMIKKMRKQRAKEAKRKAKEEKLAKD